MQGAWQGEFAFAKGVEEEIGKAERFTPPLYEYTIATTSKRDAKVQESVRQITQARIREGKFPVNVLFWDDLRARLVRYPDLLRQHYPQIFGDPLATVASGTAPSAPGLADESPVRVRRVQRGSIAVARLTSGQKVLALVERGLAFVLDHDELESEGEVELVSQFLQELHDWGDIGSDLGPADRVRESFRITQSLIELGQAGFAVIGGNDVRVLEGGIGKPTSFPVVIIKVIRVPKPEPSAGG